MYPNMQKLDNAFVSMKPTKGRIRTTWARPRKKRGTPPPWRSPGGSDSGTKRHARTVISRVKAASAQNTALQGARVTMKPPSTGATIGAKPTTACSSDMARASILPCATSTRTARPTDEATPPPKPWRTRPAMRTPAFGAKTHTRDPARAARQPTTTGPRLPSWSETAPPSTWPAA